ncbi:MAG: universal stress protein [Armatimonadota bacterium]|jgi:nucleotide-binding universal stress UspA family protein
MSEYSIVVGLGNPENVGRLMQVGCMMAVEYGGSVEGVTVVDVGCGAPETTPECHDRMSRAYGILDEAQRIADLSGTRYTAHLAIGRPVAEMLEEVAQATGAGLIVVGFSEREHPEGGNGDFHRLVDEIAARAPCNLLVARFVGDARYDRVLVPVRARLDLDVRRDLLIALQNRFESRIEVVHFASTEAEAEEMRDELERWLVDRGVADRMSHRTEVREDSGQAIVDASADYDLVVIGTAPLHEVRRKLFGPVSEHVANHAHCSTFLIRTRDVKYRPKG